MERKLEFSTRTERDTVIVDVAGQIDLGTSPPMRKAALDALKGTKRLAINLTRSSTLTARHRVPAGGSQGGSHGGEAGDAVWSYRFCSASIATPHA